MFFCRPPSTFYGDNYHLNFRPEELGSRPGGPLGTFAEGKGKNIRPSYDNHLPYKYPFKYQYGRRPQWETYLDCPTCPSYDDQDNRSKLPRVLPPWPLTLYTKNLQRPFPDSSYLILTPTMIIPFIPFGLSELSIPSGWEANYIVER